MKNHELLDMIGEVNEDYVQAADGNAARPRFRWRTWAACAACAALIIAAYPISQTFRPQQESDSNLIERPGLHSYILVENKLTIMTTESKVPIIPFVPYAPGVGTGGPANEQGGDAGSDMDGAYYGVSGQDAPAQETAAAQYDGLLRGLGGQGGYEPETYPDWYGGAWIDNSCYPEAKLTVAIVDGFRTDELEAQIVEWCGGEVVFQAVQYSWNHLDQLMTPVSEALKGTGLPGGIGVDVMANCLGVDIYSDGSPIPDAVLAKLAQLDPDGGAIRVRLFTGRLDTLTDEILKAPAPGGVTQPAPGTVEDSERETSQIAAAPNAIEELPQTKSGIIAEGE